MNQKNRIIELYWLLVLDLICIFISYALAMYFRFGYLDMGSQNDLHYTVCLSFMLFSTAYSLLLDWNRSFLDRGYFVEGVVIVKYNIIMLAIVGCFLFLIKKAELFSRLHFAYFIITNTILTWLIHVLFKKILRQYLKSRHGRVNVMLITESDFLETLLPSLKKTMPVNYEITSLVIMNEDRSGETYDGIRIIAGKHNLMSIAKQQVLDEVFIRVEDLATTEVRKIICDFESMGVTCHYSVDIADWNSKESAIGKFGKYTVISYSIYNIDYRRLMLKRLMDIVGGIVGIGITLLLFPIIAFAIIVESKGPILFAQTRIGKNGRRFQIYKFRSMYIDAEERKKELQEKNEMQGLMFKIKDDPRITKVGKFLRKTSLDELPQFYNILVGDMSLVGTRPPTEDEFEQYSLYYRRRLCMTPGLTGLWQVSGRSDIENFDDVVKYDLEYIDNWSLSFDIKILIQTIWVVFIGKGSK